jgi:lysophospholipase L1-like esterase
MNNNRKVIILIISVTLIHLLLSLFATNFIADFPSFKNVNLLSEITKKEKIEPVKKSIKSTQPIPVDSLTFTHFEDYKKKGTIMAFNADSLKPSLKKFSQKLLLLSEHKKTKIRIAWFGDSQIEGDFITEDLRKLLQNYFGQQKTVGFVPINSISAEFRHSAKINALGYLKADNFKRMDGNSSLFFSGYSFFTDDLAIDFKDNSGQDTTERSEKWLLYGKGDSIAVRINDSIIKYPADSDFNRILLGDGTSSRAKFQVMSNKTPLYGISSEPTSGIVLDNFSFRGITGVELKKINAKLLAKLNETGYYDLVVFQYGVNLMFKPDDTNYDYYYRAMKPVLKKFKKSLPNTEFLILSCSDRAFKYENEWKTAVGLDSLVYTQARLAHDSNIPFFNFYKSIGGEGTIVKWADSTVQLANKDYIHFNFRGSKKVANIIFKAIINDYQKAYKKTVAKKPVIKSVKKEVTI